MGQPDANGQGTNSVGSLRIGVIPGNPATQADEADLALSVSISDVRRKSDLADYGGNSKPTPHCGSRTAAAARRWTRARRSATCHSTSWCRAP